MQPYYASIHYTLMKLPAGDPLTHPATFVELMTGAFEGCPHEESLWLIRMNPKWRPIARTLLRAGPMAAAMVSPRDLFRVALRADANAIAVVRREPTEDVAMAKHDHRALKRFGETAAWLNIQFVDYLVLSARSGLRQPRFHS